MFGFNKKSEELRNNAEEISKYEELKNDPSSMWDNSGRRVEDEDGNVEYIDVKTKEKRKTLW